jgi:hypothetical protein
VAQRVSQFIRQRSASNIHHATNIATAIGLPLNVFATITFSLTECPPDEVSWAFRKLLSNRYAHWARRVTKRSPTHVWAIEAAADTIEVHWLVHVPVEHQAEFRRRLMDWTIGVTGGVRAQRAIKTKPVNNLVGIRQYILKGMDAAFAADYGVRHQPQGAVYGKRAGTSQNLGPAAKRRLRETGAYPKAKPLKIRLMKMRAEAPANRPVLPNPG